MFDEFINNNLIEKNLSIQKIAFKKTGEKYDEKHSYLCHC